MLRAFSAALLFVALSLPASAEAVRIASWNITNLHHEPGVELRPGIGTRRNASDFPILARYGSELGRNKQPPDIIALQEIGTEQGARAIFPDDQYLVIMAQDYHDDLAAGREADIYTAVAIRKDRGISVVRQDDLDELGILHVDGRPVRTGTAVLLDVNGSQLWVLSVHLKSSCSTIKNADTSTNDDCETFWKQRVPLSDWIAARREEGIPFVIAGDFNRRFRQFGDTDPFWRAINGGDLDEPVLVKHPETVTRKCPTRLGTSTEPIDWILLDAGSADLYQEGSYWETRYSRDDVDATGGQSGTRLSDHCPISIDVEFD